MKVGTNLSEKKPEKSYEIFWHIFLIICYASVIFSLDKMEETKSIEFYQDFIRTMAQANLTVSIGLGAIIVALLAILFPTQERHFKRRLVMQRKRVKSTLNLFLAFVTTSLASLVLSFAYVSLELSLILVTLAIIPYMALTSFVYRMIKILHAVI